MKTIVKKNICIETKKHDFENQFAYIETWHNAQLKDCYFAEKEYLWPDGTIKSGGRKYFFCKVLSRVLGMINLLSILLIL